MMESSSSQYSPDVIRPHAIICIPASPSPSLERPIPPSECGGEPKHSSLDRVEAEKTGDDVLNGEIHSGPDILSSPISDSVSSLPSSDNTSESYISSSERSLPSFSSQPVFPPSSSFSPSSRPLSPSHRSQSLQQRQQHRTNPFNSNLWLSIELTLILGQIFAASVVLAISRNEKPQVPLGLWLLGYAMGCVGTLPLLYWRYTRRNFRRVSRSSSESYRQTSNADRYFVELSDSGEQSLVMDNSNSNNAGRSSNSAVDVAVLPADVNRGNLGSRAELSSSARYSALNGASMEVPVLEGFQRVPSQLGESSERTLFQDLYNDSRVTLIVERFKIGLDCFFAVWFVLGNVWIFGGHASTAEAPKLYNICIVFLTFSCISYAVPLFLCATICCCLPCIIAFMGLVDEPMRGKGAAEDVISSLPTYKYQVQASSVRPASVNVDVKNGGDSDSELDPENRGETGLLRAGTPLETVVSGEDAVCCICLAKYAHGEELRELPCSHHFHVTCVDTWLKINANCPLCKHEIRGGKKQDEGQITATGRVELERSSSDLLPV